MQRVLSYLGEAPPNTTTNTTSPAAGSSLPIPASALGPLSLVLSSSALREWLKLILLGGVFETCRRAASGIYTKIVNHFYLTVEFHEDDNSYDWMMVWLAKQKIWAEARDLQISTRSFGLSDSDAVLVPGEEEDASSLVKGGRKLAYMPSYNTTQTLWYKRRWMRVTRTQTQTGYYNRSEERLTLCILTRHHHVLNELLLEAKREYMAAKQDTICIYVSDNQNEWRQVACRPKRPLRSIVLDPGVKDLLLDDATDFLSSKAWYAARGIPFRRGYLLYGAPGSGKTSIIHSLAGELGLDVYIISLSRSGMDDSALSQLISDLPDKCIALMEDIDAAFTQSLNRDAPTPERANTPDGEGPRSDSQTPRTTSKVSLSGLLNALDGIGAQEGRILFATTNKYSSLDPALCRPGRMDIHIEFKLASKSQAAELYRCFYLPDNDKETGGCEDQADNADRDSESTSLLDGTDCGNVGSPETSEESVATPPPTPEEKITVFGNVHRHRGSSKISRGRLLELANEFGDAIPEREFSMASLQGYLMGYKTRPDEAVGNVVAWIEKERSSKPDGPEAS